MPTPFKKDVYDRLVEAYRVEPGNKARAARIAGCSIPTARKAWEQGWTNRTDAPAIKDLFFREQEAIRAQRAKEEQARLREEMERQILARKDAVEAKRDEATGAKASRKNALSLAVVAVRLLESADAMAKELKKRVDAGVANFSDEELRRWITTTSTTVHRAETVMRLALQIERVVAGEPEATIGIKVEGMSPKEMVRELGSLHRTFARAEKLAPGAQSGDGAQSEEEPN